MPHVNDTLNLSGFQPERTLPLAAVEAINHPEAVAAARARIAALPETFPIESTTEVPSLPTKQLETDRDRLRDTLQDVASAAPTRRVLPSIVSPVLTAVGIFVLMLVLFKSPVILSQLGFAVHKTPTSTAVPAVATSVIPADPSITIPKINIHAPVIYEPHTDDANFQHALESGVVHYANTAVPGQTGNVAIFGHSSNDWWEPGNYKFVFVLLDKLAPGDKILVDYQSKRYTYEVTGSQVVDPTDVAVLNPTATPTLSLITCTPPGTSWKRLVVTAKQIDPDPAGATKATVAPSATNSTLSSAQPGFFTQMGQAWNGIVNGFTSLFGSGKAKSGTTTGPTPSTLPASN